MIWRNEVGRSENLGEYFAVVVQVIDVSPVYPLERNQWFEWEVWTTPFPTPSRKLATGEHHESRLECMKAAYEWIESARNP